MDRRELQRAVVRGVKYLDRVDPDWWKNGTTLNGIDIDTLNLAMPNQCVLGQRFRNPDTTGWRNALGTLNLSLEQAANYGFYYEHNSSSKLNAVYSVYSYLTERWIEIIVARRHPRRTKGIAEWITPTLRKPVTTKAA